MSRLENKDKIAKIGADDEFEIPELSLAEQYPDMVSEEEKKPEENEQPKKKRSTKKSGKTAKEENNSERSWGAKSRASKAEDDGPEQISFDLAASLSDEAKEEEPAADIQDEANEPESEVVEEIPAEVVATESKEAADNVAKAAEAEADEHVLEFELTDTVVQELPCEPETTREIAAEETEREEAREVLNAAAEPEDDIPAEAEKPEAEEAAEESREAEKPEAEEAAEESSEAEAETAEEEATEAEEINEADAATADDGANSETEAKDDGYDPLAAFEIDKNGHRVIPEDLFPDNALSQSEPTAPDGTLIIDLLGDPIGENEEPEEGAPSTDIPDEITAIDAESKPEPVASKDEKYNPDKPRRIDVIFDFVELLIFTLVAVLFVTSFFVKHAVVDGGSMLNTLEHGDVLLISDVFYTPEPGDVIVFEDHTLEKEVYRKPLVKRVIAVEGQKVTVKRDGIYVSYADDPSKPLYEPYVFTDDPYYEYVTNVARVSTEIMALESFGYNEEGYWFIVPEGEIFVLGDHRDDSTDSRTVGTIRTDAVLGKVLLRIFPFEKIGGIDSASYD